MHTEKNITEALLGTLFGIDGKSKDTTPKARVDQEELCHRPFLDPRQKFRRDNKNFIKGRVVKHSTPPALTGQQILDQINALEPDPERLGYFKGYNKEHAWTHKT